MAHSEGWIPDDEILDRRGYEEQLVQALVEYARTDEWWIHERMRLTRTAIVGSYPGTLLELRVEGIGGEVKLETKTPVWSRGNGRVNPNRVWRWTASRYAGIITDGIREDLATRC